MVRGCHQPSATATASDILKAREWETKLILTLHFQTNTSMCLSSERLNTYDFEEDDWLGNVFESVQTPTLPNWAIPMLIIYGHYVID